jgi:hypothetical protein
MILITNTQTNLPTKYAWDNASCTLILSPGFHLRSRESKSSPAGLRYPVPRGSRRWRAFLSSSMPILINIHTKTDRQTDTTILTSLATDSIKIKEGEPLSRSNKGDNRENIYRRNGGVGSCLQCYVIIPHVVVTVGVRYFCDTPATLA